MKIFADWCVKNEAKRIEASLHSLLPYVDEAVCVDSGSTDGTLEIIENVRKDFSCLKPTISVDIGPHFNMSISRNAGLHSAPKDTTWYMHLAGDEVYDNSIQKLRPLLETMPSNYFWVYTWTRHWIPGDNGNIVIAPPSLGFQVDGIHADGSPNIYRYNPSMIWNGRWNREHLLYPNIGSFWRYHYPTNNKLVYFGHDLWFDHYGWADEKRFERKRIYEDLDKLEAQGKIPGPQW